jgi:hypothetical protein
VEADVKEQQWEHNHPWPQYGTPMKGEDNRWKAVEEMDEI